MAHGIYYLVKDITEQCACSHFCEVIITLYVNTCIGKKNGYKPLLVTFGLGISGS